MATFARGYWLRKTITTNQPLHKELTREPVQTTAGTIRWIINVPDMRGIPAIGRNCPGAMPGTRPDHSKIVRET